MEKLTHRDRVIMALNHKEPDMVPMEMGSYHNSSIHVDSYLNLRNYLGIKGEPKIAFIDIVQQAVRPEEEVLRKLDIDTRGITYNNNNAQFNEKALSHDEKYSYFKDDWGVKWGKPKENGYYFDLINSPLKNTNLEEIENYDKFPDPDDPRKYMGVKEKLDYLYQKTDYAIIADISGACVLEEVWFMIGLERYLIGLMENSEEVIKTINKVIKVQKKRISNLLEIIGDKVQIIGVNGDVAGQTGPLMSPKLYREVLKPFEKDLLNFIREKTDAILLRHSCGDVVDFILDFIEIGINGINPVQVSARQMNTAKLKESFGNKLCFWGGIDTQYILPRGSVREVKNEVKKRIRDLAPGGGYLLGAVHNIQRDVPPQNICAMFEAAREFGQYPIK